MRSLRVTPPGRVSTVRLWVFAIGILVWALLVVLRLNDLQIVESDSMRAMAKRQHERVIHADPRRGMILDRMGRELAVSTDVYSVYAAAEEIEEKDDAAKVLARVLDLPASRLRKRLSMDGFTLLKRGVEPAVADEVRASKIPGIHLVTESKRFYPRGTLASHLLGFVVPGEAKLREGLERRYDPAIRGTAGALVALRDAHGRHFLRKARQRPEPGQDLITSLDEVIQHIAERELANAIAETGAKAGSVVVQHTPTGEILAMANWPDFNPNQYGQAKAASRRNRAIMDYYEPGSTFKIVTAAAALEEGLVRPSEIIDCQNGAIRVGRVTIRDHKNVCAIKVGLRLDPRTYHDYIARFGFGARTGVDLPGESRGLLRPVSRWSQTSQASISFGQEIGVTALQLASAFSTVANGGVAVAPRVVTRILRGEGKGVRAPERPTPHRVVSESTAATLVDLMEGVVEFGTGQKAAVPGYTVAGKTGTAQKIVDGTYSADRYISSFCGFVPSRGAVLTINVLLDDPPGDFYHGGDVAAPVFSAIAGPVLAYLGVPKSSEAVDRIELASMGAGAEPKAKPAGADRDRPRASRRAAAGDGAILPVEPRRPDLRGLLAAAQAGGTENPAFVPAPDLAGAPLRDAVVSLAAAGLKANVSGEGFVARQDPPPGTPLPAGSVVRLELARLIVAAPGSKPPPRGPRTPRKGFEGMPGTWREASNRLDGDRGGEDSAHADR